MDWTVAHQDWPENPEIETGNFYFSWEILWLEALSIVEISRPTWDNINEIEWLEHSNAQSGRFWLRGEWREEAIVATSRRALDITEEKGIA